MAIREKSNISPRGWLALDKILRELPKSEDFMRAGTLVIDSWTLMSAHLERLIAFHAGKIAFTFTEWGALLKMSQEAITIICDLAKAHNKDIIFTVHERDIEVPGAGTKVIHQPAKEGSTREFIGTMELRVGASVAGQFSKQMGMHFTEVYGLEVRLDVNKKPQWICRVHPDGKRDLRTSYKCEKDEYTPPDFREIWRKK